MPNSHGQSSSKGPVLRPLKQPQMQVCRGPVMSAHVRVFGGTGFIGSAVVSRLREQGVSVSVSRSPRLRGTVGSLPPTVREVERLADTFDDVDCVINAAGVSDALAGEKEMLDGANGLLPGLLARAASLRKIRLVHISSAAVQGRLSLDSTERYAPFSAYSRSKVIGEHAVLAVGGDVCVFRPPGVHAPNRQVTRSLVSLASSPLSSVASPGSHNSPQAQLGNVADAISVLALYPGRLPRIVHLPSEGVTTSGLLTSLGHQTPMHLPNAFARATIAAANLAGSFSNTLAAHTRRLEILWLGQEQSASWLTQIGWRPPAGIEGWARMSLPDD